MKNIFAIGKYELYIVCIFSLKLKKYSAQLSDLPPSDFFPYTDLTKHPDSLLFVIKLIQKACLIECKNDYIVKKIYLKTI